MNSQESDRAACFALWSGRNGLKNTIACFILALPCALSLHWHAERTTAEPVCRAYAEAQSLSFIGIKQYTRDELSTVCVLLRTSGETSEVSLQKLVPFLTDLWVSFALDLKFTLPGFAVVLAAIRTLFVLGKSARRADD